MPIVGGVIRQYARMQSPASYARDEAVRALDSLWGVDSPLLYVPPADIWVELCRRGCETVGMKSSAGWAPSAGTRPWRTFTGTTATNPLLESSREGAPKCCCGEPDMITASALSGCTDRAARDVSVSTARRLSGSWW